MRRQLVALGLLTAALSSGTTASHAAAPERTGWWSTATVSGATLPSTTGPSDLHIALSPAGTLAYAAVSYHGPDYASAVLTLHVVPNSQVGTPAVLACPTRDDTWHPGGNQPASAAPAYDCAGRSVVGVLGTDPGGAPTLSFLLDPSQQLTPGVTSLALVPASGTAFSIDLAAPDAASLMTEPAATPGTAPPTPATGSGSIPTPPTTTGAPPAPTALTPGSGTALPPIGQAPAAPQVATTASPAPPVLAGPPARAQVAAGRRGVVAMSDRRAAAVLLLLVLGGFGYALVESRQRPPRLLGGRARAGTPTMPADAATGSMRGIGRFARPRTEPARRLL